MRKIARPFDNEEGGAHLFSRAQLKALLPKVLGRHYPRYLSWRYRQRLAHQYDYDKQRFYKAASNSCSEMSAESLQAQIVLEYHRIEKGLALPNPRPLFGLDNIHRLTEMILTSERRSGPSLSTCRARAAITSYVDYNGSCPELAFLSPWFNASTQDQPATKLVQKADLLKSLSRDFESIARARHSVRNFTGVAVSAKDIRSAVSIAQTAPSVCNRQSSRAHVMLSTEAIKRALSFQNGNRGFGHMAGALIIVTSDMRTFSNSFERNQCWIDGGLFAMTLNLALHAKELGTCMLNWSADSDRDYAMRKAICIPDHEAVIMMMAVGHLPDSFRVATSARAQVDAILTIHDR